MNLPIEYKIGGHYGFMIKQISVYLILLFFSQSILASDKVALVIGNNDYSQSPLRNPYNDAIKISELLEKKLDFEVFLYTNVDNETMKVSLEKFSKKARNSQIAMIFFAGHGIQVDGHNYLLPIDFKLQNSRDLRSLTRLDDFMGEVQLASYLGLVFIDACRENPFLASLSKNLNRTVTRRGLARVESTPKNILVTFATKENSVAQDGIDNNSPYTIALLNNLTKNIGIRRILGQVRDEVMMATNNQQQPFTYGSLGGATYCLFDMCGKGDRQIDSYFKEAYLAISQKKLTIPYKNSAIYYARLINKLQPNSDKSKQIALDIVKQYIEFANNQLNRNHLDKIMDYLEISKKIIKEFNLSIDLIPSSQILQNNIDIKYPSLNININKILANNRIDETEVKKNFDYTNIIILIIFLLILFLIYNFLIKAKINQYIKEKNKKILEDELYQSKITQAEEVELDNNIIRDISLQKKQIILDASGYSIWTFVIKGGWGNIYRSSDNYLALKILQPKINMENRLASKLFEKEFFLLQLMKSKDRNNENIINTYDNGLIENTLPYYTMDFVEGLDLAEILAKYGALDYKLALYILEKYIRMLGILHHSEWVYCDISPENIIFEGFTKENIKDKDELTELLLSSTIKFIDFNSAMQVEEVNSDNFKIYGKNIYMPPEYWKGLPYELKSDIYQLGILCYEILTGDMPFYFNTDKKIKEAHLYKKVVLEDENIPNHLNYIISSMLEKEPKYRPTLDDIDTALFDGCAIRERYDVVTSVGSNSAYIDEMWEKMLERK